jgi:hypothetical protein
LARERVRRVQCGTDPYAWWTVDATLPPDEGVVVQAALTAGREAVFRDSPTPRTAFVRLPRPRRAVRTTCTGGDLAEALQRLSNPPQPLARLAEVTPEQVR